MSTKHPMSRRTFIRGSGVLIGLPFLEAMMPRLAWSAVPGTSRLVVMYGGVPTYFPQGALPFGPLGATLPRAIAALAPVRQHVSVLTNMCLPEYAGGTPPPGGCLVQQHYTAPAPSLAGMTTLDAKPMMYQCHTADQVFADARGTTTKLKSIQAIAQAIPYNEKNVITGSGGQVSSRFENGVLNVLQPTISPLKLWDNLFSGSTGSTTPSSLVLARKSVLDLVLDDAARVQASLSGTDKIRLEQHFEEIRSIERGLASPPSNPSGGCSTPTKPGADVPPSTINYGGWASETLRRDQQADILAFALACDLTRSVSWQLTYDQCWLGGSNISGINKDLHQISHDVNNDTTGTLKPAMQDHYNWHCAGFARIVEKLANMPEGAGSVLDSTFLGFCTGEGISAHGRRAMHVLIAGCKGAIKLGEHIPGNGEHTARVWISGMNALGLNQNTLGQISGNMPSILK